MIERGDLRLAEAFCNGDEAGVRPAQWEAVVASHELGDSKPVGVEEFFDQRPNPSARSSSIRFVMP